MPTTPWARTRGITRWVARWNLSLFVVASVTWNVDENGRNNAAQRLILRCRRRLFFILSMVDGVEKKKSRESCDAGAHSFSVFFIRKILPSALSFASSSSVSCSSDIFCACQLRRWKWIEGERTRWRERDKQRKKSVIGAAGRGGALFFPSFFPQNLNLVPLSPLKIKKQKQKTDPGP